MPPSTSTPVMLSMPVDLAWPRHGAFALHLRIEPPATSDDDDGSEEISIEDEVYQVPLEPSSKGSCLSLYVPSRDRFSSRIVSIQELYLQILTFWAAAYHSWIWVTCSHGARRGRHCRSALAAMVGGGARAAAADLSLRPQETWQK